MNDKLTDDIEIKDPLWRHGKPVSHLTSSENSMHYERKQIIRQALEFDIIDIRSYTGYKGDLLIEITTIKRDVAQFFKEIGETLEMEIVIQKNILSIYEIYCITSPVNGYELK